MGTGAKARVWGGVALAFLAAPAPPSSLAAQQTITTPTPAPPPALADPLVQTAEEWIGRALTLRGFYGGQELSFDAQGHVQGEPKVVDWTLAGMNLDKVSRTGTGELLLQGPRVAIRFNPDQHQFERHPQKDEALKIMIPATDVLSVQLTMAAVFSVGIDPRLERSMPPYWKHYFLPATPWTGEDNVGAVVSISGAATLPPGLVMPLIAKKSEPEFSGEAQRDRVRGTIQLRVAVGVDGVPRQIMVRQPLGYGLDQRTVEAVEKYRFQPGMQVGKPAVVEMIVNQPFDVSPPH